MPKGKKKTKAKQTKNKPPPQIAAIIWSGHFHFLNWEKEIPLGHLTSVETTPGGGAAAVSECRAFSSCTKASPLVSEPEIKAAQGCACVLIYNKVRCKHPPSQKITACTTFWFCAGWQSFWVFVHCFSSSMPSEKSFWRSVSSCTSPCRQLSTRRETITSIMVGVTVMRTWVEPVVAGSQVASAFYDTALLLVVKNYYNLTNATAPTHALEDAQQKAVSNFYIIYNLVLGLSPLVSAYGLSKLGDRMHRKIPICFSLLGYLCSKTLLLLLILLGWPVEVMYGAAAFNGLTGGFTTFWAGIMALGSLGSSESRRSLRLIIIELVYGLAGFVGSMASGYLFVGFSDRYREGTLLVSCSIACYAFCFFYSIFVLTVPKAAASCPDKAKSAGEVGSQLPAHTEAPKAGSSQPVESSSSTPASPSKLIIAMLFVAAILYDLAVAGAMDVLPLFLLREPLSWNAVEIGYGNAAGYAIFLTSFLGVFAFSKYLKDITMIMIGVISFSTGILIMAFVQWTFLFYIGELNGCLHKWVQAEKGAGCFGIWRTTFALLHHEFQSRDHGRWLHEQFPRRLHYHFPLPTRPFILLHSAPYDIQRRHTLLPRLSLSPADL